MPKPNHATGPANNAYCKRCSSTVGEQAKKQPTNVDGEVFCPWCFVFWRMHQPEESGCQGQPRFQAHQAAVCRCQFCGWLVVSFGALPGQRIMCSHCTRPGAIIAPAPQELIEPYREAIEEAAEKAGLRR